MLITNTHYYFFIYSFIYLFIYLFKKNYKQLKSDDNIHRMTYITKIMLTGIAIKNWVLR